MINPLKPNYDQLHEMYVSKRMSTIMIGFKKPYSASAIKWGTAVKLSAEGARI